MITIDADYHITMTRGDTFVRELTLKKNNQTYTPQQSDVVRFALAKVYKGEPGYEPLLIKTLTPDGNRLVWRIDPQDTADLDYGKYVYDLQITYADGSVETFCANKKFKLLKEVE